MAHHRHSYTISWETLTSSKDAGGLGIKSSCHMNLVRSLQANHIWRLEDLHFPLPQLEQLIRGIPVVQLTRLSDSFVWPHNNGVCLVSSASKFLYQQAQVPFNSSQRHWI